MEQSSQKLSRVFVWSWKTVLFWLSRSSDIITASFVLWSVSYSISFMNSTYQARNLITEIRYISMCLRVSFHRQNWNKDGILLEIWRKRWGLINQCFGKNYRTCDKNSIHNSFRNFPFCQFCTFCFLQVRKRAGPDDGSISFIFQRGIMVGITLKVIDTTESLTRFPFFSWAVWVLATHLVYLKPHFKPKSLWSKTI